MRHLRPTHRHHRRRPQPAGAFLMGVIGVFFIVAAAVIIVHLLRGAIDLAGGDIGRAMAWLAVAGGVSTALVELGRRP